MAIHCLFPVRKDIDLLFQDLKLGAKTKKNGQDSCATKMENIFCKFSSYYTTKKFPFLNFRSFSGPVLKYQTHQNVILVHYNHVCVFSSKKLFFFIFLYLSDFFFCEHSHTLYTRTVLHHWGFGT